MSTEKAPPLALYSIQEFRAGNQIKKRWMRLGVAFQNSDGSFNLLLNALPIASENGVAKLHMRIPLPKEEEMQSLESVADATFYDPATGEGL